MQLDWQTLTYDAIEARRGRVVASYRVARLVRPGPALWRGRAVVVVALDWRNEWQQLALLADGRRVLLGEVGDE